MTLVKNFRCVCLLISMVFFCFELNWSLNRKRFHRTFYYFIVNVSKTLILYNAWLLKYISVQPKIYLSFVSLNPLIKVSNFFFFLLYFGFRKGFYFKIIFTYRVSLYMVCFLLHRLVLTFLTSEFDNLDRFIFKI